MAKNEFVNLDLETAVIAIYTDDLKVVQKFASSIGISLSTSLTFRTYEGRSAIEVIATGTEFKMLRLWRLVDALRRYV